MSELTISFNGEQKLVQSGTVEELLAEFELAGKRVAVELNREVIPRDSYNKARLQNGDCVEIVQFVGGG